MPNISTWELVVVGASLVLFLVVPGILAWIDDRRQRRLRRAEVPLATELGTEFLPTITTYGGHTLTPAIPDDAVPEESLPVVTTVSPLTDVAPEPAPRVHLEPVIATPPVTTPIAERVMPAAPPPPPAARPVAPIAPVAAVPAPREEDVVVERVFATAPLEPAETGSGRAFKLGDLRQVRAGDLLPRSIEVEDRLWQQGDQWMRGHRGALWRLPLECDVPPASTCYAGAVQRDDRLYLRFLLFPYLWPGSFADATDVAWIEANDSPRAWTTRLATATLDQ